MCGELRFHDVATLAAELGGLHMFYGAVRSLSSDHDVDRGGCGEEDRELSKVDIPVRRLQKAGLNPSASKEHAECN